MEIKKYFLPILFVFTVLFAVVSTQNTASAASADTPSKWFDALDTQGCMFCDFIGQFIQITDKFAKDSFDYFNEPVLQILTYAFAIWIVIKCGTLMLGFGPGQNPSQIFWDIIKKSSYFFILSFMLMTQHTNVYWDVFYKLPMAQTLEFANGITEKTSQFQNSANLTQINPALCGNFEHLNISSSESGIQPLSKFYIKKLTCQVEKTEQVNFAGLLFGLQVILNVSIGESDGWFDGLGTFFASLPTVILQALGGFFILILFAAALLYYSFFMLDIIFRLTFLSSFAPFFIGFYLFEPTRQFTSRFLTGLLQSFFTIIAASTVYGCVGALLTYLPVVFNKSPYVITALRNAGIQTNPQTITDIIFAMDESKVTFGPTDAHFWFLAMAGLLSIALTKKISGMIQAIFGFSDGGAFMADKALGTAASVTKMAMGATVMGGAVLGAPMLGLGAKGLGMGIKAGGGAALRGIGGLASKVNPMGGGGSGG